MVLERCARVMLLTPDFIESGYTPDKLIEMGAIRGPNGRPAYDITWRKFEHPPFDLPGAIPRSAGDYYRFDFWCDPEWKPNG